MNHQPTLASAPTLAARRVTRSGHQFVEGERFVMLVGVAADAIDAAELEYFREVAGPRRGWRGDDVALRGRTLVHIDRLVVDRVEFHRASTGERAEVQFDLTSVFPRVQPRRAGTAPVARPPARPYRTLEMVLLGLAALMGLGLAHLLLTF